MGYYRGMRGDSAGVGTVLQIGGGQGIKFSRITGGGGSSAPADESGHGLPPLLYKDADGNWRRADASLATQDEIDAFLTAYPDAGGPAPRRRINPLNIHAARRAIRRLDGLKRTVGKVLRLTHDKRKVSGFKLKRRKK